jgi:hypothetical protein
MVTKPRERVRFASSEIWITDRRIQVLGWYYGLKDIRKVSMKAVDYSEWLRQWMVASCLVVVLMILALRITTQADTANILSFIAFDSISDYVFWALILFAFAVLAVCLLFVPREPKGVLYVVRVYRRFYSTNIFASIDKARAESVLHEIEAAIAEQRAGGDTETRSGEQEELLHTSDGTRTSQRPPVIVGDLLVAGNKSFRLEEVQATRIQAIFSEQFRGWIPLGIALMLNNLALYAERHFGGLFSTLSCLVGIALVGSIVWRFVYGGSQPQQTIHIVTARGAFGNVIVYASMDRVESAEVRNDLEDALQGRIPPQWQPSASGG